MTNPSTPLKILLPIILSSCIFMEAEEMQTETNQPKAPSFTLPTSRPVAKNGWNLFVTADWLYWQANETGLGYAFTQDDFNPATPELMGFGEIANPSFDWASGFRLGFGYNIPHDQWDLALVWTWYDGSANDSQSSSNKTNPTVFPSFIHPNLYNDENIFSCLSAESDLSIHLNVIDLDLGRQFKAGKWLSLRPYFGIRSAWVNQVYDVNYYDLYHYDLDDKEEHFVLNNYDTHIKNDFWGIGPKGGLGIDCGLKWGLSLFGDLSASLLYGLFETSYTESFTLPSDPEVPRVPFGEDNNFHAGRAILDSQLGLRWNTSFSKERFRLVIQAAWEHHMFFSQNQILRFVDGQSWGSFVQNQGDLYFQGWTASSGFYF